MNKKYLIVFLWVLLICFSKTVEAATVSDAFSFKICSVSKVCTTDGNLAQWGGATLWSTGKGAYYQEGGKIQTYFNKNIDLIKEDGSNTTSLFDLDTGKTFRLSEKSTEGGWIIDTGKKSYQNHIFNDYVYTTYLINYESYCNGGVCGSDLYIGPNLPKDFSKANIVSSDSNIVSCIDDICTGKNPGTATITIKFPKNNSLTNFGTIPSFGSVNINFNLAVFSPTDPYDTEKRIFSGTQLQYQQAKKLNRLQTKALQSYSFNDITYTVVVSGVTNTTQVSSCSGITKVTDTSAIIDWAYSDIDGDVQDGYQIEVATSSDFAIDTIVKNIAGSTSDTSANISGLNPGITYYARIRTHNSINGDSVYSSCGGGFTTLCSDGTTPVNGSCTALSLSCSVNPLSVTIQQGLSATTETVTMSVTASGGKSPYPLYTWAKGSDSGTGSTYIINSINSNTNTGNTNSWTIPVTFYVTDAAGGTKDATCSVTVFDENIIDQCNDIPGYQLTVPLGKIRQADGSCMGNNGGTTLPTVSFFFNPNTVSSGEFCKLHLTAENVGACQLRNRLGNVSVASDLLPVTADYKISILETALETVGAPIGTHTLYCSATTTPDIFLPFNTQKCFSDSNIKEN